MIICFENEKCWNNFFYCCYHFATITFYHAIFIQRFYKKAAAFVLRAVAKHSPQLAQSVVDCGALDALVICLEEFDPGVKEAAAWALGYIARHNAELAQVTQHCLNFQYCFA